MHHYNKGKKQYEISTYEAKRGSYPIIPMDGGDLPF